jgi:hypothetical protein
VPTTFMSYGSVAPNRQGEIIKELVQLEIEGRSSVLDALAEAVLQRIRSTESIGTPHIGVPPRRIGEDTPGHI